FTISIATANPTATPSWEEHCSTLVDTIRENNLWTKLIHQTNQPNVLATFKIDGKTYKMLAVPDDGDCGISAFTISYNFYVHRSAFTDKSTVRKRVYAQALQHKQTLREEFLKRKSLTEEEYYMDCIKRDLDMSYYVSKYPLSSTEKASQELETLLQVLLQHGTWLGDTLGNCELQFLANSFDVNVAVLYSTCKEQCAGDYLLYQPKVYSNKSKKQTIFMFLDLSREHYMPLLPSYSPTS
ncbi:MAG: hypothetical protein OXT67_08545, partial [Zetaproteobacteria bacterium]|nr:hypothetical protein [Zetaproteobacteria bacterium]